MTSMTTYLIAGLSSLCCCLGFFLILFLIVGLLFLRKKGKQDISAQEAVKVGAEQVSQMFVRPKKSREELMREEDEEERRR
jgi:hypothetical protein